MSIKIHTNVHTYKNNFVSQSLTNTPSCVTLKYSNDVNFETSYGRHFKINTHGGNATTFHGIRELELSTLLFFQQTAVECLFYSPFYFLLRVDLR